MDKALLACWLAGWLADSLLVGPCIHTWLDRCGLDAALVKMLKVFCWLEYLRLMKGVA